MWLCVQESPYVHSNSLRSFPNAAFLTEPLSDWQCPISSCLGVSLSSRKSNRDVLGFMIFQDSHIFLGGKITCSTRGKGESKRERQKERRLTDQHRRKTGYRRWDQCWQFVCCGRPTQWTTCTGTGLHWNKQEAFPQLHASNDYKMLKKKEKEKEKEKERDREREREKREREWDREKEGEREREREREGFPTLQTSLDYKMPKFLYHFLKRFVALAHEVLCTNGRKHKHTHSHMQYACTHSHLSVHARARTHTHIHTHTRTHTQTTSYFCSHIPIKPLTEARETYLSLMGP